MPYIKNDKGQRYKINDAIVNLMESINNEGELNYAITTLLLFYIGKVGLSYSKLNTIMGVLSCVGKEFYRRVVAPYEDKKIEENGDLDFLPVID